MKKSWIFSLVVAAAVATAVSTHAAQASSSAVAADGKAGTAVTIDNFSFSPATLTVPDGTTVVWTNKDDIPHTVVERNQKFKSKGLDTDDAYSYTFSEPGTYEYFCGMHPKMVGKIVVEAKK